MSRFCRTKRYLSKNDKSMKNFHRYFTLCRDDDIVSMLKHDSIRELVVQPRAKHIDPFLLDILDLEECLLAQDYKSMIE